MIKYQNILKLIFRSSPQSSIISKSTSYASFMCSGYRFNFSDTKKISEQEYAKTKQMGKEFYSKHVEDIVQLQNIEEWKTIVSSTQQPLLIDFYADWCGPCKKLTPKLEQRVKKAQGKLKLLKINIDKFGQIANIFQIKSVPTVYLIYAGKAVDAFSGDISDEKLQKFLESAGRVSKFDRAQEQVVKQLNQVQILIRNKQFQKAEGVLVPLKTNTVKQEFGYVRNIFLAYVYSALNKHSQLKALVDLMKQHQSFYLDKQEFKDLYLSLLGMCQQIEKAKSQNTELTQWKKKIEQEPSNLQIKFEAAQFYKANQLAEDALNLLLQIVKANKEWEDKKANKAMLAFFKELGPTSPLTQKYRKLLQRALN